MALNINANMLSAQTQPQTFSIPTSQTGGQGGGSSGGQGASTPQVPEQTTGSLVNAMDSGMHVSAQAGGMPSDLMNLVGGGNSGAGKAASNPDMIHLSSQGSSPTPRLSNTSSALPPGLTGGADAAAGANANAENANTSNNGGISSEIQAVNKSLSDQMNTMSQEADQANKQSAQVLQQASQTALAQANSAPQSAMNLLKGQ